jgi:uncharacterized membrane protein YfhO
MLPTWIQNYAFVYGGDLKPQHFQFYTEFRSLMSNFIHNRELPFYSWDIFLGNNFYASKAYYIMGDIYAYISLLFNTHFYNIFIIQTFIKLSVSYITFYFLSRTYKFSYKVSMIIALCYSLSSWVIFFIGQPMFVSFYSFMPLYFLGIELYIRKKNYTIFLISSALCLFTNYYLFFAISMFSPIYYLSRYYIINSSFKNIFTNTTKLIALYLIGVSITAVLILPAGLYIAGNDRVGEIGFILFFDKIQIYFHQLQAFLVPSQLIIYQDFNIFESGKHVTRELCMWAGSITALLVPQFLSDKNLNYRKTMKIVYLIFIVLLIVPTGSMLMLGFSSYSLRWVVLIIFTNLLVSGRYLNDFSKINYKNLKITIFVFMIILLLNYPVTLVAKGEFSLFITNINSYFISLIFLIYFLLLYILIKNKKEKAINIIIIMTVFELLVTNFIAFGVYRKEFNTSWDNVYRVTHTLQTNENDLNNYLNSLDEDNYGEYYRVYIPRVELYWDYSHNQSVFSQLNGVMTYDSTYAPSFIKMKEIAPQVKDFKSEWIFTIEDQILLDFTNVKYAIVTDSSQLPDGDYSLIDDKYLYSLLVYENNDYRKLGMTYDSIIKYSSISKDGSDVSELLNNVVAFDKDYSEISKLMGNKKSTLENIQYESNHLYGTINSEDSNFMVLTLPYDKGWSISINGEKVKTYSVNAGMMGFEINKGYNEVYMSFIPYGFKTGLIISIIAVLISVLLIVKEKRKNNLSK